MASQRFGGAVCCSSTALAGAVHNGILHIEEIIFIVLEENDEETVHCLLKSGTGTQQNDTYMYMFIYFDTIYTYLKTKTGELLEV